MGTRLNRRNEAVLTSIHNLCFRAEIRKNVYPCKSEFYYINVELKGGGGKIIQACFRDVACFHSFYVPNLLYLCCLGKAVHRDCGISYVLSHIFYEHKSRQNLLKIVKMLSY